jgi:hypothetical protein
MISSSFGNQKQQVLKPSSLLPRLQGNNTANKVEIDGGEEVHATTRTTIAPTKQARERGKERHIDTQTQRERERDTHTHTHTYTESISSFIILCMRKS